MKAILFLLVIFIVGSCSSNEPVSEEDFNKVKERKLASKDTSILNALKTVVPIKLKVTKVIIPEKDHLIEWDIFKQEAETKIRLNEIKIAELKKDSKSNSKESRKISLLEKRNNDLRIRLDRYREDLKVMWENFKTDMNHDVNGIEIELKDMDINQQK